MNLLRSRGQRSGRDGATLGGAMRTSRCPVTASRSTSVRLQAAPGLPAPRTTTPNPGWQPQGAGDADNATSVAAAEDSTNDARSGFGQQRCRSLVGRHETSSGREPPPSREPDADAMPSGAAVTSGEVSGRFGPCSTATPHEACLAEGAAVGWSPRQSTDLGRPTRQGMFQVREAQESLGRETVGNGRVTQRTPQRKKASKSTASSDVRNGKGARPRGDARYGCSGGECSGG
jgi:hypothetical protein